MTSPADELRTAATKLRKAVEGTTPTPWRLHLRYYRKNPAVLAGAVFETPVHTYGVSLKRPHLLADARWKAVASPAIAEPLANLLEKAADRRESAVAIAASVSDETETVTADDIDTLTPLALAVARALNGGQS